MKSRPVIPRQLACRDVDRAIHHYLSEGGRSAALAFIAGLERAYAHIGRYPASGSPRFAHELDLPGLRAWPLTGFPYLVFYVEGNAQVDVWRVLHSHADIPTWLQDVAREPL